MAQSQSTAATAAPSVSLRDLMTQPTDSFERPKALPEGHYLGTILGFEFGKSRNKGTDFIRVAMRIDGLGDDIDEVDVKGIDLSRRELRRDFFITPNSMYRLGDFLDAVLGAQPGKNADERLPDIKGTSVLMQVTQRPAENDPETVYNDVNTIVAA